MIKIVNVSKRYDSSMAFALNYINLNIEAHECLVLLGKSGSGKSTLLRLLNRLEYVTSGDILINNTSIATLDKATLQSRMSFVFQKTCLFPHLTLAQNIALPLRALGWSRKKRLERAQHLLSKVELDAKVYANKYPDECSGGEAQRVSIARALATDPDYLLMDEPFSALDPITRQSLQQMIQHLKISWNKTIVFVTHNIDEAFILADRIAIFDAGQLQQVGLPAQIRQSQNTAVQELIGAGA